VVVEKLAKKTSLPAEPKTPEKASSSAEKTSITAKDDNEAIARSCVNYNPDDLFIKSIEIVNHYTLSDGVSTLPFQIDYTTNAEQLLQIARRYKRVCSVESQGFSISGATDTVVEWMEPSGRIARVGSSGLFSPSLGIDYFYWSMPCHGISAEQLSIERDYEDGPFFITSSSTRLLKINSPAGAKTIMALSRQYSKLCIIGSPGIGILSSSRVAYFE